MSKKRISLEGQTDDSALVFTLNEHEVSPKSWYDLNLTFSNDMQGCVNGFMDFGDGLVNCSPFVLYKGSGRRFHARLFIDDNPVKIVLPDIGAENGSATFVLEKCSKLAVYSSLASRVLKTFMANPVKNFPRLVRNIRHFVTNQSFTQIRPAGLTDEGAYKAWIHKYDFDAEDETRLTDLIEGLKNPPKISIVVPVYKTDMNILKQTIESVQSQIYTNWELCICIDGELNSSTKDYLETLSQENTKIGLIVNEVSMGISGATNKAFSLVTGAWTGFLDHDDLLRPHSLAEFAIAIDNTSNAKLIYSDEDKIDDEGRRFEPHFKCGFSDELILSMNYFNHMTLMKTDEIKKAGKWDSDLDGAQDYDMVLRVLKNIDRMDVVHIPKILYHWRASIGSEAKSRNVKQGANLAGAKAVENYLHSKSYSAQVSICEHSGYNKVRLSGAESEKISVIIPTRNQKALLERCVSSIFEKTTHSNFEVIIVDNGSDDPATKKYMEDVSQNEAVTVLSYDAPFNYSEINNFAVEHAVGDIICLLNNDTKVLSLGWLAEMQSWLQLDGVGCVGAKLFYPDQTVQHGGVILGIGGIAGHSHKYFQKSELGYFGRLSVVQNFSAVTAACMMFRKADFLSVGGLNSQDLAVSYNDVDLCLKFLSKGLRTVWTPYVELIHYESMSRGKGVSEEKRLQWSGEAKYMLQEWEDLIKDDPYYSQNLSRLKEDFSLRV